MWKGSVLRMVKEYREFRPLGKYVVPQVVSRYSRSIALEGQVSIAAFLTPGATQAWGKGQG